MISAMHNNRNLIKIILLVALVVLCWIILHKKERNVIISANKKVPQVSKHESDVETDVRIYKDKEVSPCFLQEHYQYSNFYSDDHGVNVACSNAIPLIRSIPDIRKNECKGKTYSKNLPKASVIIVFQKYTWSTLMRTIHSVINRSPRNLLEEILLIDDYSGYPNITEELLLGDFNLKVNVIQNKRKRGAIHARYYAAENANGEVIIYLSAYCEVNVDWLPPLLERIHSKENTVAVPITDMINTHTFEYQQNYQYQVNYIGVFNWDLQFREWISKTKKYSIDPYESSAFSGGMFAIKRDFFLALGGYDSGLLNARGENIELSLKIWNCGGTIEIIPCSRVGDIFRGFLPTDISLRKETNQNYAKQNLINNKRIVATWFGEKHKEYYYYKQPVARFVDPGNISDALSLKEKLKCKNFEWYLNNVAYSTIKLYPVPPSNQLWGKLVHEETKRCVGIREFGPQDQLHLIPCETIGLEKIIRLNIRGYLEIGDKCIESDERKTHVVSCAKKEVGPWRYIKETHDLYHTVKKKCLERENEDESLLLAPCEIRAFWKFIPNTFT